MASPDFPLISEKERRLIQAIYENNVELLKVLLDSSKWYNTTDDGYNLLQIAILNERKEVFDYLLSLPDYPLEFKNSEDTTAAEMVLDCFCNRICECFWMEKYEYFACELIKKGARIDKKSRRFSTGGNTLLHSACKKGFVKASILLIERGIDVNACGYDNYTPLQQICEYYYIDPYKNVKGHEIIFMLLEFGADTSVRDVAGYNPFENSVSLRLPSEVQEALFYYTYDEFSFSEIHFDILFILAIKNSPLLYEIIKQKIQIIVENDSTIESCVMLLKLLKLTDLKLLIKNFETSLRIFFKQLFEKKLSIRIDTFSIEKFNLLIKSSLKDEIINVVIPLVSLDLSYRITNFFYESELSEYICFLLSYGMEIDEDCLYSIYERFGYCDLFKILLHIDIKKSNYSSSFSILPSLLINVTENLEDLLKNTENIQSDQLKKLMRYFAHPKLYSMYKIAIPEGSINVPNVPSLLELSRNQFRSYFVNKFHIKTSNTFYTLLNCLEISPVYKNIITYETKLYSP